MVCEWTGNPGQSIIRMHQSLQAVSSVNRSQLDLSNWFLNVCSEFDHKLSILMNSAHARSSETSEISLFTIVGNPRTLEYWIWPFPKPFLANGFAIRFDFISRTQRFLSPARLGLHLIQPLFGIFSQSIQDGWIVFRNWPSLILPDNPASPVQQLKIVLKAIGNNILIVFQVLLPWFTKR